MSFDEYLLATDRPMVMPAIKEQFESLKPMGALHQQAMKAYREWMLVGGMPQAVSEFVRTHDFGRADFTKQRILSLYTSDMEEQNEERTECVRGFFERIPSELSKHDKRYVISHVNKGARMREYAGPVQWLDQAMVVNLANNVDDPSAALNLTVTDPSFKCYLMDTGLLVSLAHKDGPYLENELYRAILLDKLHVNEGMVVENATAQSLRTSGHRAFLPRDEQKDAQNHDGGRLPRSSRWQGVPHRGQVLRIEEHKVACQVSRELWQACGSGLRPACG